jgi:hypothetical protein
MISLHPPRAESGPTDVGRPAADGPAGRTPTERRGTGSVGGARAAVLAGLLLVIVPLGAAGGLASWLIAGEPGGAATGLHRPSPQPAEIPAVPRHRPGK